MSTHRIIRRVAAYFSLAIGAALVPAALEAACNTAVNPITGVETITCCGDTACCSTQWQGSVLVKKTCF